MGTGNVQLKPDIVVKNYWRNNEQFADFFNAVLFQGKNVIKPDELEELDTEESSILEHKDYAETIVAARDQIKIRKKSTIYGVEFVILGMEHQEHIHYAMAIRTMGYDYGSYKKQYEDNAAKYKGDYVKGLSEDEYLSRMKKTDKLVPVITVVVYYGEKPWDGAVSLHGMLQIPKEMTPFVNDYKMCLIEARKNDLKLHNINNQDLFNLLGILLNRNGQKWTEIREKAVDYVRQNEVEKTVMLTAAGVVNNKIDYGQLAQKGDTDMCSVFEEAWQDGKTEGKAEEIVEMGREFGLSDGEILIRLQSKLNVSVQKAQDYLVMFTKQTV